MQVKTEEERKALLLALLAIARQNERAIWERYYNPLRLIHSEIKNLLMGLEDSPAFRVYQFAEIEKLLIPMLQPIMDETAEVMLPRLSAMSNDVAAEAAEFVGRPAPPTAFKSPTVVAEFTEVNGRPIREVLGTFDEPFGTLTGRMAENISKVVKVGLLTDRTTEEIAADVMGETRRRQDGRMVPLVKRGTAANQNLNILNNMTRTAVWDELSKSTMNVFADADVSQWIWEAKLDPNTCPVCIPKDGTIERNIEDFGEIPPVHPNCRCLVLPFRLA